MREIKEKDHFQSGRMSPGNKIDEESYKTCKGKVGVFAK